MWNFENMPEFVKINPNLLEIVKQNDDYILLYGSEELKTPSGNPIISTDQRVLQFILTEISLIGGINFNDLSGYLVFSYQTDFIETGNDFILSNFNNLLEDDYFFKIKILKQQPQIFDDKLLDYFSSNLFLNNIFYEGFHSIRVALNNFITDVIGSEDISATTSKEKFINFLFEKYSNLSNNKKSLLNLFVIKNHRSLIIPYLLLNSKITAQQYIIAVSYMDVLFDSNLIEDFEKLLLKAEKYYFKLLSVLDFSKYFDIMDIKGNSISELINQGENTNIEFKSTLRWNIKEKKKDSAIEHAVLKTICSFLNSKGGNLFIGVKNDGSILGIELDAFENEDKFLLHLWNLIKDSIGEEVGPYINTTLEKIDDKIICNVKCLRSSFPIFLKQKGFNEEYYIRIGPSCMSLSIRDSIKYIENHFPKKT